MLTEDTMAISPIDGRYRKKTSSLRTHFSEAALISFRIKIEISYLHALAECGIIPTLQKKELNIFAKLKDVDALAIGRVKEIEKITHHDVKAIEYYLREEFEKNNLTYLIPFIHFAITSEDINNLAYRSMLAGGLQEVVFPSLKDVVEKLNSLIVNYVASPILARTHGQAAIPTTFGKEIAVFVDRILLILEELKDYKFHGKFSGAVGGYQAMQLSFPKIDWQKFSRKFVESFGFNFVETATQIAPADDLVKLFSIFYRINSVFIGLNQDVWRYISDGWLLQKGKEKFVGSSTMPQKINPIEFENSEGNLILANSLLEAMMRKLPISRLQRDLSESTVLRNIGVIFAHCLLAYDSLSGGLAKLSLNEGVTIQALQNNYNILTEAWQTLARKNGDQEAYEKIAKLAKNKNITKEDWQALTENMGEQLQNLTPEKYLGLSEKIALDVSKRTEDFFSKYSQYKLHKKD